jgi:hypothetical protein
MPAVGTFRLALARCAYRRGEAHEHNTRMVEKAVYGITALRYADNQIVEAMMGLVDENFGGWDLGPAPTKLVDVVDRLVEGDTVVTVFPGEKGRIEPGPQVQVDVLAEGTETLSLAEEEPGKRLADLPRF